MSLVAIIECRVKGVEGALGDSPGGTPLLLDVDAKFGAFIEQAVFVARENQIAHEVLKHGV